MAKLAAHAVDVAVQLNVSNLLNLELALPLPDGSRLLTAASENTDALFKAIDVLRVTAEKPLLRDQRFEK